MVLVDTSVWIQHFRAGEPRLAELLSETLVLMHPLVLGELACGNLKNRASILRNLEALPAVGSASHEETLHLIHDRKLWGQGIGWIDAHLLASAMIARCRFWTLDERLKRLAGDSGVRLSEAASRG
jgi:predicted nucleic acid-binding protein